MRITVRIDENHVQKIKIIQQKTYLNATNVIKQGIDLLYAQAKLSAKKKNSRLLAKLAGTGRGPKDGSVNYKQYVSEHIDEKFDHR